MRSADTRQRLSYKFQRLRETIREAIVAGELSGKCPGERELARRYQVNAKTVSKALSDLMSEGLLVREVGRGTFVRRDLHSPHPLRASRRYRWVVDAHANHADHKTVFAVAEALAANNGHRLTLDQLAPTATGELASGWISPSALKHVDGVIVFNSRVSLEFVADLTRRRIPLVMTDAATSALKANTVRPDYARGAFELTEYLLALGHRHVALIPHSGIASSTADCARGWQAALARHELPIPPACRCERRAVTELMTAEAQPTAMIVAGSHAAEMLGVWLAGLPVAEARRPALAVLLQPGQRLSTGRMMASYRFDAKRIVEWSLRLLGEAAPGQPPQEVVIPGMLTPGDQPPVAPTTTSSGIPHEAVF